MKKILAIVLMMAVLVCPVFASGEASGEAAAAPAAAPQAAAAADQATAAFTVEVTKEATCVENGLLTYTDTISGSVITVEIPATGIHTPSAAEPTCTEDVVCLVCGQVLEPATGHSYVYQYDAVRNEDGSFASAGTWQCENCGDVVAATEGNAVYYYGLQENETAPAAPAAEASGEASAEASGEASAEEAAAVEPADPNNGVWATVEIIALIVLVVECAVLMLSFGKKKIIQ